MTSSSKQIRQKTQQRYDSFPKRTGRKYIFNEQNNDHAQVMHKIKFHSFNNRNLHKKHLSHSLSIDCDIRLLRPSFWKTFKLTNVIKFFTWRGCVEIYKRAFMNVCKRCDCRYFASSS